MPSPVRLFAPALVLALATGFAPRARPRIEAATTAKLRAPLRTDVRVTGQVPPARQAAWDDFRAEPGGDRWLATWDAATGVPSRVFGGSIWIPGANASPLVAETVARQFLESHLELLAPGVVAGDLELVADHDDGRIRTIGFVQRHGGLRVVGGQVSVRFLNDHLYVISSQIYPDIDLPVSRDRVAGLADTVRAATIGELALPGARAGAPGEVVILPLVTDDTVLGYRLAAPVEVDAGAAGAWRVYADPATGAPLVREELRDYASGTLVYDVPNLYPGGGRADLPAPAARITVDGAAITTAADGTLTWNTASGALVTSVDGDLVHVSNTPDLTTPPATASLPISDGGTTRWSMASDPASDAQLSAFVRVQVAKAFARVLNPDPAVTTWLDSQTLANVNIDDQCNAYYNPVDHDSQVSGTPFDGTPSLNFFAASAQCENTARIADVVYHEFGHGVHDHSVIPGVGLGLGADFSEGAADFFAALITGDHELGKGFFLNDQPLRDLDPPDHEAVWPTDVGEIHTTGLIFGGAFWDLRTDAIAALGDVDGIALTEKLYVAALQRATDTPSVLIEALAADDDDGDLGNGTPHDCLIREAFGRHGLRPITATVTAPGQIDGSNGETMADVSLAVAGLSVTCSGDEVDHVQVTWEPRHDSRTPTAGQNGLLQQPGDVYVGQIPLPDPGDVVDYHFDVVFFDGSSMSFPDNLGDPDYQLYRGALKTLYCTDFESDPFSGTDPWTHDGDPMDLWQWGTPTGAGGDPPAAYSGDNVVGMALDGDGMYVPGLTTHLISPTIDVGQYSDVRLQYRRWLGVEDAFYDHATIYANGEEAYRNAGAASASSPMKPTRDKEWVFRDVPLSSHIYDGTVQLSFELTSDGGLEFGGWTLDDVCVVADPNAVCGNGTIDGVEQCDDGNGNADTADACRVNCRRPVCGDGILDSLEECDDGNRDDGDACSSVCTLPGGSGGCCSTEGDPLAGVIPIALVAGVMLLGRRRRRA